MAGLSYRGKGGVRAKRESSDFRPPVVHGLATEVTILCL